MATTELFSSDTQRAEVLFKVRPKSDESIGAKNPWNVDGIFEFYLWNPGSGEYIGIFLYECKNQSSHVEILPFVSPSLLSMVFETKMTPVYFVI